MSNKRYSTPRESVIWGVILALLVIASIIAGIYIKSFGLFIVAAFFALCSVLCFVSVAQRLKAGEDIDSRDYQPQDYSPEKAAKVAQFMESNSELLDAADKKAPGIEMILSGMIKLVPAFAIGLFTGFGAIISILAKDFSLSGIMDIVIWGVCIYFMITGIISIVRGVNMLHGEDE